ncbi:MAG: hypothetical protein V1818_04410 [Candidatus Aenigmatarchaeota archaeon]
MKSKILLSVLSVLLVAGCVDIDMGNLGGSSLTGGSGLEIISFTAEPTSIFSGSSVRLVMEIENRGGTTVADGGSKIYVTGSNFVDWFGSVADFETLDKEMRAEDVVRGVPPSTYRYSETLTAPDLDPGQTRNDIFIARVYHDYSTSANGNVWVYSESEADAARAAGRQLYTPSFTYTKGPVGLSISVSPTPLIVYEGSNTFTVFIKINNLASGTIYSPGAIPYGSDSSDVTLTMEEINRVDVSIDVGSGLTLDSECQSLDDQELVAGRDMTIVCDIDVTTDVSTFQSFQFDVTVDYGYYTERTASVTVQGR